MELGVTEEVSEIHKIGATIREDKPTTKVHIVFDASAKSSGPSVRTETYAKARN